VAGAAALCSLDMLSFASLRVVRLRYNK
jgi:hypothetical protein